MKPIIPNNPDLYRVARSEMLIGYAFAALGGAAFVAVLGVVAYVIAGTW